MYSEGSTSWRWPRTHHFRVLRGRQRLAARRSRAPLWCRARGFWFFWHGVPTRAVETADLILCCAQSLETSPTLSSFVLAAGHLGVLHLGPDVHQLCGRGHCTPEIFGRPDFDALILPVVFGVAIEVTADVKRRDGLPLVARAASAATRCGAFAAPKLLGEMFQWLCCWLLAYPRLRG